MTFDDKTSLTSKVAVILEDGGSAYLAVESGDEDRGTVTGGGVYAAGETVKLAAKPKAKCVFAGWLANDGACGLLPFAPLMEADGLDFRTSSVSFPFRPGVMDESKDSAILAEPPEAGSPYDTITLKFFSSGAVTATGKFIAGYNERTGKPITYSATCSAVLIPENGETISDKFAVYLYFPPKVSSFDGCTIEVVLEWNGEKFSLSE